MCLRGNCHRGCAAVEPGALLRRSVPRLHSAASRHSRRGTPSSPWRESKSIVYDVHDTMKADYDSQGDTIQIELAEFRRLAYGEDVENGAVIVSVHDDLPVAIDVIGTRNHDFEKPLRTAAETL